MLPHRSFAISLLVLHSYVVLLHRGPLRELWRMLEIVSTTVARLVSS